ncbi:hypothetical protein LY28_03641 [Ruminiclostridium sufflavum DSM 19573]|uniref:Uncharacterized protein n=1 Tax=Ruminiclostridium sufflavum DSM 19573 TaxID=1121337 RepID=A0A318XFU4_9FIRM|nr:hypothetical protein [Ruminiclostridium sufflavum]PYG84327.1 hypothetical protein LY28_03641 [Ruminiclostridium sufflavum DSM 19573]
MKAFLFGIAAFIFSMLVWLFCHDYNLNHIYYMQLRTAAEEASIAAAVFTDPLEEKEGRIVFNSEEGHKAIRAMLETMLKTDSDLNPLEGSYWQDKIKYTAYFFDDSNTVYPKAFTDPETGYKFEVKKPAVIVTINTGKARYTLGEIFGSQPNIRSAAHEIEGR